MRRWTTAGLAVVLACACLSLPPPVHAAVNAARAGVDGVDNGTVLDGDGTGQARIELFSEELALVKQARDLTGTVLPDDTDVSPGQELYFVLLVDNPTAIAVADLRLDDPLNQSEFTYIPGSLEQTVVPTGSGDAAVWAAAWSGLSDALGAPDDEASALDTGGPPGEDRVTFGAEPGQTNQQAGIPAMSIRAVRFRVTVN